MVRCSFSSGSLGYFGSFLTGKTGHRFHIFPLLARGSLKVFIGGTWVSFQQLTKCILAAWKWQFWDVLCLQGLIYVWLKAVWFGVFFLLYYFARSLMWQPVSSRIPVLVWAGLLDTMKGTRQNRECTEEIVAVRVMLSASPAIQVYLICPCVFLMKNWEWRKKTWA